MKKIAIPTNRGTRIVLENNIIRIEASGNYCKNFFINDRPLLVAKILQWFERHLQTEMFYRIHRTHLINRLFISSVLDSNKLSLTNGEIIQMRRRKKLLLKNFNLLSA